MGGHVCLARFNADLWRSSAFFKFCLVLNGEIRFSLSIAISSKIKAII